ncbi:ABC transporter ATP-binding protein [Lawsonibacter sp. LCP25S3_F5]
MKKSSDLSRLLGYAGGRRVLTYLSWALSAVSALVALVPFWYIWRILKEVLETAPDFAAAIHIVPWGWRAVGFAVLSVLLYIAGLMCSHLAAFRIATNLRLALTEHIARLPLGQIQVSGSGKLRRTIADTTGAAETFLAHQLPDQYRAMATVAGLLVLLLAFDWRLGLLSLLPVAFAIVALAARVQEGLSRRSMAARIACEDGIQEYVETMADLRANNAQDTYFQGLAGKIRAMEHRAIISEFGTATFVVSAGLVLRLGMATTALAGAWLLTRGELDVLTFFLFLLTVSRLYDPLEGSLQNLAAIIATSTNIQRMNEIMDCPVQTGAEQLTNSGCDVTFDHVGFAYNDGEAVLRDVSFTARQGEVTALVGPSGGGKTTVSRLAARFWDATRGRITVGGMDVSQIDPETLMGLYSIVFQDVTLFNNTLMENIRIGRKDATDEEVLSAARLAKVDEFAEKLPDGWNTNIGENGCQLSGGERQRVSIARAFLKDAPIILLDEATASLDVENETAIQTSLSRLIQNKTVLMIAHRMRTVAGADKIVVLKDGAVAEEGSPAQLRQSGGIFAHMEQLQQESSQWKLG